MSLHAPIIKAIFLAALVGLTFSPSGELPCASPPHARDPAPQAPPLAASTETAGELDASAKAKVGEPPPPAGVQGPCADGMVLVDGDYCPEPDQVCLKWLDPP
ncbi:MAG TPA: hypothetical protein VLT33_36025, partial [Labilithrix sp.]|nr:hypothetical protein [Labilithrix sp.]